jgi:hypothetical protein
MKLFGKKRQLVIVVIFVISVWMLTVVSANISPISPKNATMIEPVLPDNYITSYCCGSFYQRGDLVDFFDVQDFVDFYDLRVEISGKAFDVPVEETSTCDFVTNCTLYRTARDPLGGGVSRRVVTVNDNAQLWSQFWGNVQRDSCRSCNADCFIISSLLLN